MAPDPFRQPSTLTAEVVTTTEGFRALAPEWDALLEQSRDRTYFQRWHWNWCWWRHLSPPGAALSIVCCRDEAGQLAGVIPLFRTSRRVLSLIPVRELFLLGTGIHVKTSEHIDGFARQGWEARVADAVSTTLRRQPDWDRLHLHAVPESSRVGRDLAQLLGAKPSSQGTELAPYIDTSQGWEHYKRTLGRSMRRNVEYYARRLFKNHACAFERVTDPGSVDAAIDDLIRLHQARWQAAGESGALGGAAGVFLRHVSHAAMATDQLRLWIVRIDGRVEAALIGFCDNGVLHYFQKGFNPGFAAEDLGTAVLALTIRDCCEDSRIRAFDFMAGNGYKQMWARQQRALVRYDVSRQSLGTAADGVIARAQAAAADLYRSLAPRRLREARRDWLRRRRFQPIVRT